MEIEIGKGKKGRRGYGFDDIAIVPSRRTRDPDDVDISWTLGPVPVRAADAGGRHGRCRFAAAPRASWASSAGSAVLNLEGIWTRYEDADEQLERISKLPPEQATREMQKIYSEPVKAELVAQRMREIKAEGVVAAGSFTPQRVRDYCDVALEAGLDVLVDPGHGDLGRARLLLGRAAQPQGVHRRAARSRASSAAAPATRPACT